jgi:hypothetical protein
MPIPGRPGQSCEPIITTQPSRRASRDSFNTTATHCLATPIVASFRRNLLANITQPFCKTRNNLPRFPIFGFVSLISLLRCHSGHSGKSGIPYPDPLTLASFHAFFRTILDRSSVSGLPRYSGSIIEIDQVHLAVFALCAQYPLTITIVHRDEVGVRKWENRADWRLWVGITLANQLAHRRAGTSSMRRSRSSTARASRSPGHSARPARQIRATAFEVVALGGRAPRGCAGSGGRRSPCPGWRTARGASGPGSDASSARPRPTRPDGGGCFPCGTGVRHRGRRTTGPPRRSAVRRSYHPASGVPGRSTRTAFG